MNVTDNDELNLVNENDDLILADEEEPIVAVEAPLTLAAEEDNQLPIVNPTATTWKVMIVDDDPEIHEVTQLALEDFVFKDKPITFLSAYSGEEAKSLLKAQLDVALIFLDVVMEEHDSGLQVAKYIRETLRNQMVRIILRTGQPGEAPEEDVIVNYEINDYKLKVELTQRKLFVTVVAGLRAYYDLMTIEVNKAALKQTLEAMPVGVTVLDAPHGKPIYVNQRARQFFGKGLVPQATAKNLAEVYQLYTAETSQQYPAEKLPVVQALRGESTSVDDIEIHQGNQIIPVETWGTPICDNKGNIIYAIAAFQDITERKRAEAERCRLEQLKTENMRMSTELNIARQLQQMLLPTEKELKNIEGLDIVGFMAPADEVGGDYYDVLQQNGRILMGIGDVTGHGLESGAVAMMVQSALRTLLAYDNAKPVNFLNALNKMVYHNVARMNIENSLTLALLDYQDGQLCLSGQHEYMIVVRQGEVELIDTVDLGFMIGLEPDIANFVAETFVKLNQGDVVVLYTDGITEAENLAKEYYGLERLCEVIKQNWQHSVNDIKQAIVEDVRQFIGQQQVFDDITLLVLKQK